MKNGLGYSPIMIDRLREEIIRSASNPEFTHHAWYAKYHLEIAERIANELLDVYLEADRGLVHALVWIHDYGKMITRVEDRKATLTEGRRKLLEIGFDATLADRVIEYVDVMDRSAEIDLRDAPIEIQIASSADGCSHLVGPFFQLWFWENTGTPFEELMRSNRHKAETAWERKIVLPEARAAFRERHQVVMELNGALPQQFISQVLASKLCS